MKFYPRFYQLVSSGNKVINTTNSELTARRMLQKLQLIDKKAEVIVYQRIGRIVGKSQIIFENGN